MAKLGRSKKTITYHSRSGRPVVYITRGGRKYVMVRDPSGRGVKRLYSGSQYRENGKIKRLVL